MDALSSQPPKTLESVDSTREARYAIDSHTRLVALFGHPVEHSRSPLIHNAAFASQQINLRYLAFDVPPTDLETAVGGLRALRFAGANVTIPHKQTVLPLLDELTADAQAIEAVNTIVTTVGEDGSVHLLGDNTDIAGFVRPLLPNRHDLEGTSAVLFGGGGGARAVLYALLNYFRIKNIFVATRDPRQGATLTRSFLKFARSTVVRPLRIDDPAARTVVAESRLLVNTTPVGMHPNTERTIWPDPSVLSDRHIVYDLVYNPAETRFLREAAAQGALTINGTEMLIAQAAASYEHWTGRPMPTDTVRDLLRAEA